MNDIENPEENEEPTRESPQPYEEIAGAGESWPGVVLGKNSRASSADRELTKQNIAEIELTAPDQGDRALEDSEIPAWKKAVLKAEAKTAARRDFEEGFFGEFDGQGLIDDIKGSQQFLDANCKIEGDERHAWLQVRDEVYAYRLEMRDKGNWQWDKYWIDRPGGDFSYVDSVVFNLKRFSNKRKTVLAVLLKLASAG